MLDGRVEILKRVLNDGWFFVKKNAGSSMEEIRDSEWSAVDLPHDWLIWQTDNLYETADAWYRRSIDCSEDGFPVHLIYFDGVYMDCDLLLNGKIICSHPYGYTAFYADLSERLVPGENEIIVHIRNLCPNSRWYSGSGIYRNVFLYSLPGNYIIPDSLYIHSEPADGGCRSVKVTAEVKGDRRLECFISLKDKEGRTLCRTASAAYNGKLSAEFAAGGISLWSPDDPVLYILETEMGDQIERRAVGFRDTDFDPDTGFRINGRSIKLKGVCLHHDLGCLGAAFHEKAARRQLMLMKEIGANSVRTSHNPPASEFLDICDEIGLMVIDEAFDMWERRKTEYDYARFFDEHVRDDVASWIRRDRCHPSVIMWSIGNEIFDMHADKRGEELTRILTDLVRSHDPLENARVTFGCNYMPWAGGQRCADVVKIPGYNYGEKCYPEHHEKHPDWVIYGSETGSLLSSRGVYHFPMDTPIMSDADLQCSSLGNSNTSWGASSIAKCLVDDLNTPYSMGQFFWSGTDYIGEPTPYQTRSSYFGQADTAGFPKDPYYTVQSFWTEKKMVHIGVSWDWNPGQMIDVPVMTNCSSAELFLNGESLGKRPVDHHDNRQCLPVWKVPFMAGELRAEGYDDNGNTAAEDIRKTSGDTYRLVLTAENNYLTGDGHDIAFVRITAEDADGVPVENARDMVNISVRGGAYLIGLDNGDSSDSIGYKVSSKRLFSGMMLAVISSDGTDEDVRIRAESESVIGAELVIPVIKSIRTPGYSNKLRIKACPVSSAVSIRKIEIVAEGSRNLNPGKPEFEFTWTIHPPEADGRIMGWEVTNSKGIEDPGAEVEVCGGRGKVRAAGDGRYYLRALGGNVSYHPEIISQIEFMADGFGRSSMDPFCFVSAGLFDVSEGDIGAGNEKGISFSREGRSMVGFSGLDFGKRGSRELKLPVFALDSDEYNIKMYTEKPENGSVPFAVLKYQKPSIWNTYQEETYALPSVLRGKTGIYFELDRKIHLKGFVFSPRSPFIDQFSADDADEIYGDSFRIENGSVLDIGNNVVIRYNGIETGQRNSVRIEIDGETDLDVNPITVRSVKADGEEVIQVVDFRGGQKGIQTFNINLCPGTSDISFVFLPGSRFCFHGFRLA